LKIVGAIICNLQRQDAEPTKHYTSFN